MCGIAGIYGLEDKLLLKKMLKCIKYRGPDDQGLYIGDNLSIGHVRLSIIDLTEAGRNPLFNEDGSIFVAFNGEIYNFRDLRDELMKMGHKFQSRTDTEVIVHAYEEWGMDCVKKFNGMFAFALFDINKKKLYLCRDQFGIKPLFYSTQGELFFFASDIKALIESGYIKSEINKLGLYYCLSFFSTPSPYTIYKGIKKLPPGYYLEIDFKKKIKITKYYDINDLPNNFQYDFDLIVKKGELLLRESIDRMRYSDVPQGVFLSGGIDSSTIVALLDEMESQPIETFSIGIEGYGEQYNELKWAQIIHEEFNTNHHEYFIRPDELPNLLQEYLNQQYDFIADPANILTYQLSKEAIRNKVKVVHVGEGADEIYCGYQVYFKILNSFTKQYLYFKLHHILKSAINLYLKSGIDLFKKIIGRKSNYLNFIYTKTGTLERLNEDTLIPVRGIMGFSEVDKENILRQEGIPSKNSIYHIYNILKQLNRNSKGLSAKESHFQDMRYLEFKLRLPELILMRVDFNTMLSSIEARVPFFDKHLLEFNLSLCPPIKIHYNDKISKYILKKIMKDKLPKETLNRKKIGLTTPVSWKKSLDFSHLIESEFSRSYLKKYFREDFLEKIVKNRSYRMNFPQLKIWQILNFCFLYRKVILKEKIIL
ncbi:MAG: asparagine synthase (glutamine-hydrolyzing) [Promethearchaeota archaeon Loki_b32]|nr:MAG: asparagine synthase (glutamine-hydrolyzing) [Candidatus Lokiarchaeota archaeon Loki_b32]